MKKQENFLDDDFTPEELKEFQEKFCEGTYKPKVLSDKEVEQLKKEGRI